MTSASPFSGLIEMPDTSGASAGAPPYETDDSTSSDGTASGGSGISSFWKNHEMVMMAIGLGVLLLTAVLVFRKSSSASNAASNTTAASGGIPTVNTSDTATAIDQQNTALEALLNAFQQFVSKPTPPTPTPSPKPGPTPTPSPTTTPTGGHGVGVQPPVKPPVPVVKPPVPVVKPPAPKPGPAPAPTTPQARYDTVTQWTATNTAWNSTLWGIANHEGISLTRVEALNPTIQNPNIIQPGQKIRVA